MFTVDVKPQHNIFFANRVTLCERGIPNVLVSSSYVAHALDKLQTTESEFHISKTASLNKC